MRGTEQNERVTEPLYSLLANTFEEVEKKRGRKETLSLLVRMFSDIIEHSASDDITCGSLVSAMYLCTHRIFPPFLGVEMNVGGATGLLNEREENVCFLVLEEIPLFSITLNSDVQCRERFAGSRTSPRKT